MDSFASPTQWERRLRSEWEILARLVEANPARLSETSIRDAQFDLTLLDTAAPGLNGFREGSFSVITQHRVRIVFPEFFPAVPMELSLAEPVAHPNIHPETRFVCLWNRHRVSHTVEHALHKLVAILGWQLSNSDPEHVMQQAAHVSMQREGARIAAMLAAAPLMGILHSSGRALDVDSPRRRRLS